MKNSNSIAQVLFYTTAVMLIQPPCLHAQDQAASRGVVGTQQAQGAVVTINQIDTSGYPKVTIFATVAKDGVPLKGLSAADFRVREDEVEQEPLTVVPKLTPLNAVVTLDTSGSMKKRLADAKLAAKSFIDLLGPEDRVQVLSFAREVKILSGGGDCDAATRAIDTVTARGDTALYDALYASVETLRNTPGRKAIALLSDGADDDGTGKPLSKNPVERALALAREINVPVFVVGVGSELDEAVLRKVAADTGGDCLIAPQPQQLTAMYARIGEQLAGQYQIDYTSDLPGDGAVHRVQLTHGGISGTKEFKAPLLATSAAPVVVAAPEPVEPPVQGSGLIDKTRKQRGTAGEAVTGGNDWEEAVDLKPGLYHLAHPQRPDEYDYFTVQVKDGQKLVVTLQAPEKGIAIEEDKVVEGSTPASSARLHDPQRKDISHYLYAHGPSGKAANSYVTCQGTGGKFFLLIGDDEYAISKEATFKIELFDFFDANSGHDAGAGEEDAVEIAPGVYPENHLTPLNGWDTEDTFKFKAKAGTTYQIKARPSMAQGTGAKLTAEKIWDEEGTEISGLVRAPNGGAVLTIKDITAKIDGYLIVKFSAEEAEETVFSIALGEGEVATPAKPAPPAGN